MPDPFAPKPCPDCGKVLPYKTLEAADTLYGGGKLDRQSLADDIAERMRDHALLAAKRGEAPIPDETIVDFAISWWTGSIDNEDYAAAVRHYGDVGHPDGTECERISAARWCHERGPGKDSQDSAEWAASLCNLEAGHEGPHSYERQTAAA